MKKYKCKPCKGTGKIYQDNSVINNINGLKEEHEVKTFIYCNNCDGTGETDWIGNLYPKKSIAGIDDHQIHLDVYVKPMKSVEYIDLKFQIKADEDLIGISVKEEENEIED